MVPLDFLKRSSQKSLIEKDAPALLAILDVYQEKVSSKRCVLRTSPLILSVFTKIAVVEKQLKNSLESAIKEVEEERVDLNNGISLLEIKYQVEEEICKSEDAEL